MTFRALRMRSNPPQKPLAMGRVSAMVFGGKQKRFVGSKSHIIRPFCRIKRDDRHHVRFDIKGAAVIDLATAAFAHTDKNRCHSWPSRPRKALVEVLASRSSLGRGAHSGEITLENVEGCLYDVRKTSELLWALDAEHAKHPVALHLSKAQSGATIAKAYLDALGVRPRLQVQPDFLKSYLGYAARGLLWRTRRGTYR